MTTKTVHKLSILGSTGHSEIHWDPEDEDSIDDAEKMFNDLKAKGYLAYTVAGPGMKGEVVTEFDLTLGEIIMVPPVAGG